MEDGVPGFSLRPEQQSSQHGGQQAIVNAVIYVFTLLEQNSTHTNKCKARHQKACTLFLDEIPPHTNILGLTSAMTAFNFGLQHKPRGLKLQTVTPAVAGDLERLLSAQQRQRNVPHVQPNIQPTLSLCRLKTQICRENCTFFLVIWILPLFLWLSVDPRIYYSVFHTLAWRGALSEI